MNVYNSNGFIRFTGFNEQSNLLFLSTKKAATEKINKQLQQQINEIQGKLDESNRTLNDLDIAKKKLTIEKKTA